MKNKLKVDVAMITKNHESFIEESIDSILNQSIPINQINIVDDGSTDSTYYKLIKYSKIHKKICIIKNHISKGPGEASNQALQDLKGKYILYTSGDDVSTENRAEIQTSILQRNKDLDCVINHVNLLFQTKKISNEKIPKFKLTDKTGEDLFYELFWNQNFLNASAVCFRNSAKIYFDKKLLYLQDYKLWLQLSMKNKIITNQNVVLDYRIIDHSLSQQVNKSQTNMIKNYEELYYVYIEILSKLSLDKLNSIFLPFTKKYSKHTKGLKSKKNFIFFLLLSHNNSYINSKITEIFQNKKEVKNSFNNFLKKNFYSSIIF